MTPNKTTNPFDNRNLPPNSQQPNLFEQLTIEVDGTFKRGGIPISKFKINKFSTDEVETVINTGLRIKRTPFSTLSGSVYSAAVNDFLIGITSLSYAASVGLPSPKRFPTGKTYIVKDEVGGALTTNITIRSEYEETIDGAATATIIANYGSKEFYSDGANWLTK